MRGEVRTLRRQRGANSAPALALRVVVAFVLLAFALQSFITQTHIHLPSGDDGAVRATVANSGLAAASAGFHSKLAAKKKPVSPIDDPKKCPLCQEFLYAGNYVPPSAVVLHQPSASVSAIVPETAQTIRIAGASHNWRGRAPPLS